MVTDLPCCNSRSRYPISSLAAWDRGGVPIRPPSLTNGLSCGLTDVSICQNRHGAKSHITTRWSAAVNDKLHIPMRRVRRAQLSR
jgi:hypothetical protein